MSAALVLLAAGGTGGHLFPAEALAAALARRGIAVELVTDDRALNYSSSFPARAVHAVPSETIRGRSPVALSKFALRLGAGVLASARLIRRTRPAVVVGFGGYPTIPPIIAAQMGGVPTIVHEQNAVMGRANRLLARRATVVATGFPQLKGAPALRRPFVPVGNPVRPAVLAQAGKAYEPPAEAGPIRLLVFGGSQGARVMADVVPFALTRLPVALRGKLSVVQQTRAEDMARVRTAYDAAGIIAELAPFIGDLPAKMAEAHLVISRSGASTVAELGVIGRPSILVPFPHALDQDQLNNAKALSQAGAATVIVEDEFSPESLAALLETKLNSPHALLAEAAAAQRAGIPNAAERLADLVVEVARGALSPAQQGQAHAASQPGGTNSLRTVQ